MDVLLWGGWGGSANRLRSAPLPLTHSGREQPKGGVMPQHLGQGVSLGGPCRVWGSPARCGSVPCGAALAALTPRSAAAVPLPLQMEHISGLIKLSKVRAALGGTASAGGGSAPAQLLVLCVGLPCTALLCSALLCTL